MGAKARAGTLGTISGHACITWTSDPVWPTQMSGCDQHRKGDGSPYYDYIQLYVDNALIVSDNAESILRKEIGRYFELKRASIGPPKMYLGAEIRKGKLYNGLDAWAASSSQYIQAAVRNVKEYIEKSHGKQWKIPNKV